MRPSGPVARDVPLFRMAFRTVCVVKGEMLVSSGHSLRRRRLTCLVVGSCVCGTTDVNCFVNAVAISVL